MSINNITRLKYLKHKSKKPGLPPGTLIGPEEKDSTPTSIRFYNFDKKKFIEKKISEVSELKNIPKLKSISWIDIVGLRDVKKLEEIGKIFNLHPLLLEDILHADQRPKFDHYENALYIVVRMFYTNLKGDRNFSEQVSIVFGKNFVISFQENIGDVFEPVRKRIREGYIMLSSRGTDHIAYMLLDAIVDNYFVVLENMGERIEELENTVLNNPTEHTLQKVNHFRQEALVLRRAIWPLRDVISRFEREESPLLNKGIKIYIRDVYDHAVQVIEALETYRDILSGMVDLYLSSISNKMNSVMKVLTIISTIFIPLTFIAGVYGMNFKYLPEVGWKLGYVWALGLMAIVALVMISYFKRKKWF